MMLESPDDAAMSRSEGSPRPTAAIVELTPDHGFTVLPQVSFLRSAGWTVEVIVFQGNADLDLIRCLPPDVRRIEVPRVGRLGLVRVLRRIQATRPQFVVINTPLGRALGMLASTLPTAPRLVIHNLDRRLECRGRFGRAVERRAIRRSPRVYVLSRRLLEQAPGFLPEVPSDRIGWFYPSFFPESVATPPRPEPLAGSGAIRVVIPGAVLGRRNYDRLVDLFGWLGSDGSRPPLTVHVLGDPSRAAGPQLVQLAERAGLVGTGRIVFEPPGRVPGKRFVEQIAAAHFVLPLIDHSASSEKRYGVTVASSTFMWARAFAVPMLCSTETPLEPELVPFTLTYRGNDLRSGLIRARALVDSNGYQELCVRFAAARSGWFEQSLRGYLG